MQEQRFIALTLPIVNAWKNMCDPYILSWAIQDPRVPLFQINFFQNFVSGNLSACQIVWIQITTDILLVLILVKIWKCYEQT